MKVKIILPSHSATASDFVITMKNNYLIADSIHPILQAVLWFILAVRRYPLAPTADFISCQFTSIMKYAN